MGLICPHCRLEVAPVVDEYEFWAGRGGSGLIQKVQCFVIQMDDRFFAYVPRSIPSACAWDNLPMPDGELGRTSEEAAQKLQARMNPMLKNKTEVSDAPQG